MDASNSKLAKHALNRSFFNPYMHEVERFDGSIGQPPYSRRAAQLTWSERNSGTADYANIASSEDGRPTLILILTLRLL